MGRKHYRDFPIQQKGLSDEQQYHRQIPLNYLLNYFTKLFY